VTARPSSLIPSSSDRPGDDPIFALNAQAKARAEAGEDVLNATLGALVEADGSLAFMPAVEEAFRRVPLERASVYAPISGPPRFLGAVIEDVYGGSSMVERSLAVATPGGTGALHHAIMDFLEPGQKLLTSSYRWGPYDIIAEHARRGVETFNMYDDEGRFDIASFEAALTAQMRSQGRSLVIFNTPCHNPTGYSLDDGEWERSLEVVARVAELGPVTFLLDFAYAKFAPPGAADWRTWLERMNEHATVLVAWSGSKAFAQYGSRVGALIASHPDAEERSRIKNALGYSCRATWSNCNHLGMLAISELLCDAELRQRADEDRARLVELLAKRVRVFNECAREANLAYPRYEGGFFVAVFTPDAVRAAELMRERGVFVVPLNGAVRVALCSTPATQVPRLVEALVEGIHVGQAR